MDKIFLLDCTLRDGGYVNDWRFGADTISGFSRLISKTGVDYFEVGFLKGDLFDRNRAVFPDTESVKVFLSKKNKNLKYVAMVDMGAPVPIERIENSDESVLDGIRVIFKKDKRAEAFEYCKLLKEKGYEVFVNLVNTDLYSDEELIATIRIFNDLHPFGVSIVDTFGVIRRKQFLHFVNIMDKYLDRDVAICYHGHNNLQQAFSNAESFVDLELDRTIIIDACVFGMGRGAGNLNLEIFAEFLNEYYGANYNIEPMLEIMDKYLNDIYKENFWGYSLPLYLSSKNFCHPNYAIHIAEKDSLTVKSFDELLKGISPEDKMVYSEKKADMYLNKYMEKYIDDKEAINALVEQLAKKDVLIVAPGGSVQRNKESIINRLNDDLKDVVVVALNILAEDFAPDYIFCGNIRRYSMIKDEINCKCILTSNVKTSSNKEYIINYSTYTTNVGSIVGNSGLMLLKLLCNIGTRTIYVAGMDGYSQEKSVDYYKKGSSLLMETEYEKKNADIKNEIIALKEKYNIEFITPTYYQ